jgi:hypothetical protein
MSTSPVDAAVAVVIRREGRETHYYGFITLPVQPPPPILKLLFPQTLPPIGTDNPELLLVATFVAPIAAKRVDAAVIQDYGVIDSSAPVLAVAGARVTGIGAGAGMIIRVRVGAREMAAPTS